MGRRKAQATPATDAGKIGHNSNLNADEKRKLKGFVDEIERVEGEIKELTTERGEMYQAAKEAGFNVPALRHRIKMRKMDRAKRDDFESACDAYAHALGDFVTTDLGRAMAPKDSAQA